jgi:N-acyl-D-amino-acid deacylase
LTSETFGIRKRGKLQVGHFADIIVFRPEEVIDHADFEQPDQLAEGMQWIILNGQLVLAEGKYLETLAGRALRR